MHEAALALGMILQRFKLIDNHRYQMHLKETLTIKPDGFKIKVRPRADRDRGAYAGPARRTTAAMSTRPRRAPRDAPGHNTPLLVLYGSNLGTAEELATSVADLAEVNGFATKLAPLDDYVGKLPEQGGVLIFCASYNGAPPDNATQFVNGWAAICRRMRLRTCATRCSVAATATGSRPISRSRDSSTISSPRTAPLMLYVARRGRRARRSRRSIRILVRETAAAGGEGIRPRYRLRAQRRRRAALQNRAGGADGREFGSDARWRHADEDSRQPRTTKQHRGQYALDAACRCAACLQTSATASAIISAWCRATIRRWWIPSRAALAFCRPTRSGCRSRKAAARNCRSATRSRSGGCSPNLSSCSRSPPASRSRSCRSIRAAR